jgi:type I restriction enzyme S subunit
MPAGTILFSSRAPIGYVAIAKNPITTNQGFRSFVPSEALDPNYAYHYLKSITALAEQLASGTTFNELSGSKAKTLLLPLPPIVEQRRIAEHLDKIKDRRASIGAPLNVARTALERLRSAVLAAACSGRLTEDWRKDHPDATADQLHAELIEVGGAPEVRRAPAPDEHGLTSDAQLELLPPSWNLVRLGDILDVGTGATPLRKNRAYYDDGTIPWVTSGAVNAGTITSPTELITPLALEETNVKLFPSGTLLVAMYGEGQTRGRVAELAIEAGTNQAVAAVLFTKATAPIRPFVRLFFEDSYQRVRALSVGGVQPNLNLGVIKDTLLPLPPRAEQAEIVRRATAALEAADRLATQIEQVEGTLDRISRAALGKAFRGELVPTEAALATEEGRDFESAEELLARVMSNKGDRSENGRSR